MSNQLLFNRDWSVTIGIPGQKGNKYDTLRVAFEIEKTSLSSSNKAKIDVYNLNSLSRAQFQQTDPTNLNTAYQIELRAGYKGLSDVLYIGDIRQATYKRSGADIVTTFECGSSEKQLILAVFDKNYPPGTSAKMIINDLADQLHVDKSTITGVPDQIFNSSFSANGRIKDTLDKITKALNLSWSIQDGSLHLLPANSYLGSTSNAIVLSSSLQKGLTGLIGVPSQNKGLTTFSALLNPKILPDTVVQIFSDTIPGNYFKINKAIFEGDSHGDKWNVNCESSPVFQSTPLNANNQTGVVA